MDYTSAPRPRHERSSFKHLGHLKHLGTYFGRYGQVLAIAVTGLLITRMLDAIVPLFMKTAIDSLAIETTEPNVMWPALGIIAIVAIRFGIFVVSRRVMRRVSISVRRWIWRRASPMAGTGAGAGAGTGAGAGAGAANCGGLRGIFLPSLNPS